MALIWGSDKAKYFCGKGLTASANQNDGAGNAQCQARPGETRLKTPSGIPALLGTFDEGRPKPNC